MSPDAPWPPRAGELLPRAEEAYAASEKLAWILSEEGHGPEWARVLRIGPQDSGRFWEAIAEAVIGVPTTEKIAVLDVIELTEPFDGIPAGATGGALELMDDGKVMVEITSIPELDAVERIIFPPPSKLRRIGTARTGARDIAA